MLMWGSSLAKVNRKNLSWASVNNGKMKYCSTRKHETDFSFTIILFWCKKKLYPGYFFRCHKAEGVTSTEVWHINELL